MNAHSTVASDYSRAQTRAEWERDTKLRDIRERYDAIRQRLTARQQMEEGRVRRAFLTEGRY